MHPEDIRQKVGQFFDGQDIDFASHPVFSNKYLLRGADENHFRYIFNPNPLSYLENTVNLSVKGSGNRLIPYRQSVLDDPSQFQAMGDEALRTANLLAS